MPRPSPRLVIDARPRGPTGLLAAERVLGQPVLAHLLEASRPWSEGPVSVHARIDDHGFLRGIVPEIDSDSMVLMTGPPPEGAVVLRTDRLYDPRRLGRVVRGGRDPESAVIWRLDRPMALDAADDELRRRRSYQPIGRFWALTPARAIARALSPTAVRPNAVTLAAAGLVLGSSAIVAFGGNGLVARLVSAIGLAIGLVLDTADGHLARLQGTASDFGRWLDSVLDELGDMALHAAIAWSCFTESGKPGWLVAGMFYAMSKYLFHFGNSAAESVLAGEVSSEPASLPADSRGAFGRARAVVRMLGHADLRWHLWIVLAALGRLDLALIGYAAYFGLRAATGAIGKAVRHA